MPTYEIECVDRETGSSETREYQARDDREAMNLAIAEGWVVGSVKGVVDHPTAASSGGDMAEVIRALDEMNQTLAQIQQDLTMKRLRRAIGSQILIAMILLIAISALLVSLFVNLGPS